MTLPEPPRAPPGHPADATEWAEYLRRYDRYLDLLERWETLTRRMQQFMFGFLAVAACVAGLFAIFRPNG